ncbi:hypothetical protein MKZ38_008622 [Zalerion maritima]|uniref:Crh-like protein n=1 Tax=Zalerion maritima TaxID=339359 RepID=A0AAD5WY14_9PEZI|nr:hypothetical protein MKZ38_008622 [Zalerion maritima]
MDRLQPTDKLTGLFFLFFFPACPDDPALGKSIHVDFRNGEVNSFTSAGGTPTYDDNGVSFTVAQAGDSPQLISLFYLMFGRVEFKMKAAPGVGIVSSLVFQSDDLDEIDLEWLGADTSTVQTNYFGKGITGNYDRAEFNPTPDNQADFVTYTVDWTSERIVWSVEGTVVRTLTADEAGNEYPQSPMTVRFGSWSGGDPANRPGTIEWAGGETDYSQGPFSMIVSEISITDYSTGSAYRYTDNSGSWASIEAVDGEINGNLGGAGDLTTTATATAAQTGSPTIPAGGIDGGSTTSTPTGWPWESSATPSTGSAPDGWVYTDDGKIVPAGSTSCPSATGESVCSPSASGSAAGEGSSTLSTVTKAAEITSGATSTSNEEGSNGDAPLENTASSAKVASILAPVLGSVAGAILLMAGLLI